jgi:hypothetical protein
LTGAAKTRHSLARRTVRWCTGQCLVRQAGLWRTGCSREFQAAYDYNSLDCPVSQRPPVQWSAAKSAGDAWPAPTVDRGHQTLSGAPTSPKIQRSAALGMEGDPHRTYYSGCPVVHRTVRCATRQKARITFLVGFQRLLATLGL